MKNKFLIIQTGDPVPLSAPNGETFADWFIDGMQVSRDVVDVVNVHKGETLPNIDHAFENYLGLLITGSKAMVTEGDDWVLKTQAWLRQTMSHKIPMLGICFGHQLLADMLGGEVGYNPKGRRMGLSRCSLSAEAATDPLFQILPQPEFDVLVSHSQTVISPPPMSMVFGHTEADANHLFRYHDFIWGVQYHPEWDEDITAGYIKQRREDLKAEGLQPDQLLAELKDCPDAKKVLSQFVKITSNA